MTRTRPFVFAASVSALLLAAASYADQVDDLIRTRMTENHVPGLTLLVAEKGKVVKSKGYGFAQVENQVRATPDTVYELASVSKQFTATAVLMLAHEGKLSLEDSVARFIPNAPDAWSKIRIRHLLNHTSGLIDIWFNPAKLSAAPMLSYTAEAQLSDLMQAPLLFEPGDKHEYSSAGYFVLGQIVANAGGRPFYEFVQERILKPCNMKHTRFRDATAVVPNIAQGYTWRKDHLARHSLSDLLLSAKDDSYGGLLSTTSDLLQWHRTLMKDVLLPQKELVSMWSPTPLNDGKHVKATLSFVGYGWFFVDIEGHTVLHHGGVAGTMILRVPKRDLVVIMLSNLQEGIPPPFGSDRGYDYERLGLDILKVYLRSKKTSTD